MSPRATMRRLRLLVSDAVALLAGVLLHLTGRRTPDAAYQAMIRYFCRTAGRSNDLMARLVRVFRRNALIPRPQGELGVTDPAHAARIAEQIRRDGFHVFEEGLPAEACDRLLQFALSVEARVRPLKGQALPVSEQRAVYDPRHPLAVRYDFDADDVLDCPDVQAIMSNPAVLSVAQDYLGTAPIADVVSMWWHTSFSSEPDEEAAQFFHFDMDRIKWLKFFIYLTDVGPDNGPHSFVKGSHRTGGIPRDLLAKGYARLSDEEIARHYASERIVQFLAPRGTVLAEDTRGLHKGLALRSGHRLMLQVQFSNSLFGASYPRSRFRSMVPVLERVARAAPSIYKSYLGGAHF